MCFTIVDRVVDAINSREELDLPLVPALDACEAGESSMLDEITARFDAVTGGVMKGCVGAIDGWLAAIWKPLVGTTSATGGCVSQSNEPKSASISSRRRPRAMKGWARFGRNSSPGANSGSVRDCASLVSASHARHEELCQFSANFVGYGHSAWTSCAAAQDAVVSSAKFAVAAAASTTTCMTATISA